MNIKGKKEMEKFRVYFTRTGECPLIYVAITVVPHSGQNYSGEFFIFIDGVKKTYNFGRLMFNRNVHLDSLLKMDENFVFEQTLNHALVWLAGFFSANSLNASSLERPFLSEENKNGLAVLLMRNPEFNNDFVEIFKFTKSSE